MSSGPRPTISMNRGVHTMNASSPRSCISTSNSPGLPLNGPARLNPPSSYGPVRPNLPPPYGPVRPNPPSSYGPVRPIPPSFYGPVDPNFSPPYGPDSFDYFPFPYNLGPPPQSDVPFPFDDDQGSPSFYIPNSVGSSSPGLLPLQTQYLAQTQRAPGRPTAPIYK